MTDATDRSVADRAGERTITLPVDDDSCGTIEGFVPWADRLRFAEGFLAQPRAPAQPSSLFRVCDGGTGALLAAETRLSGWRFVALFPGVAPATLREAIAHGSLLAAPDALHPGRPGGGRRQTRGQSASPSASAVLSPQAPSTASPARLCASITASSVSRP